MKKAFTIACVAAIAAGTALHFLYSLLPNPLTALIAPVNESVWEHLKLLFWPALAAAGALAFRVERPYALWGGFFLSELVMPAAMLGVYYLLKSCFGVEGLGVDIALYVLTMGFGFFLAYQITKRGKLERAAPYLLLPVVFYGAALILFTFAPPPLGIFQA